MYALLNSIRNFFSKHSSSILMFFRSSPRQNNEDVVPEPEVAVQPSETSSKRTVKLGKLDRLHKHSIELNEAVQGMRQKQKREEEHKAILLGYGAAIAARKAGFSEENSLKLAEEFKKITLK